MRRISKIIVVLAIIIIASQSCKKSAFDINENPNNPTDSTVTFDVVLPAALSSTASTVSTGFAFLQNWMGYWARSGSYSANSVEESYSITTGFGNGVWNNLYDNLYDYQVIINKASVANAGFYEGIARIMKAHNYQILVDVYNNIPYKDALKGSANITPAYDNGVDIYKDLFRQIDTALTKIDASVASLNKNIATDDIMFKGNKVMWHKFANTLKLRMLVHLFKVPNSELDKAAEVAKITADGNGYLGVGQSATINPGYRQDKPNPFYNIFQADVAGNATGNNRYYRANKWGIGYYEWNGDARINRFYAAVGTDYVGVQYGLPPSTTNAYQNLSPIGPGLYRRYDSSVVLLTSAESFFLQAEAIQRGILTTGTALTAFTNGINESFVIAGSTVAAATSYMTGNATYTDVDFSAASTPASATANAPGDKNYTILSQKWFALNGFAPFEVWTDWRRTDVVYAGTPTGGYAAGPALSVSPAVSTNKIPTRLLYPQTEYNYNAANVSKQGTINGQTSKIFWDR